MKSGTTWFLVLAAICLWAPYGLGMRPRTAGERRLVAVTIAFLAWLLLFDGHLR